MDDSTAFFGSADFVEALYEDFLSDPDSVPDNWRRLFAAERDGLNGQRAHSPVRQRFRELALTPRRTNGHATDHDIGGFGQAELIRDLVAEYRSRGHLIADIDPIRLREKQPVPSLHPQHFGLAETQMGEQVPPAVFPGTDGQSLRDVLAVLQQTYCRTIGFEYEYISDTEQVAWLRERVEPNRAQPNLTPDEKRHLLQGLTAAEGLERYLHRKYVGQKRFSLEGGDSLVPMLDDLVTGAGSQGVKEVVIGMAHRGRLNVLVNILGKQPADLFSEFEGNAEQQGSGDVKYHQGFSADLVTPGGTVHLTLSFNPSHLEIIAPVVEGSVRSRQERRSDPARREVLPVLIHGDAAFAGQGVVMETLNLGKVRGYATGGTVHIVVNNQIGFTTSNPLDSRSTLYCTDIAKLIQAPIFHVNGDDPEALIYVTRLALDYRMRFNNDVVIDLVCYRRHGHNEADEPAITQPIMYRKIAAHPPVRQVYADRLIRDGQIDLAEADAMMETYQEALAGGGEVARGRLTDQKPLLAIDWAPYLDTEWTDSADTTVPRQQVQTLSEILTGVPDGFQLHPRVAKILEDRKAMAAGQKPLDWGFAETMAYATLLMDGYRVRLSGQDSGRGTFAHRHAVLHDQAAQRSEDKRYVPLQHLDEKQPRFLVIDSLLSEEAVLAFEYGYSSADPQTLVVWEAQFGDFANGAQVVIDQFLSSSEAKWQRLCGMVLLLPHGFEGQGPEHSSARLERYLQLCAEHNMQVVVPSTPAQMFHMLRRQMLRPFRKPLIVMSPKSLLRHKDSVSSLDDLVNGHFKVVIDDDTADRKTVRRVVLCAGKVYFDLLAARRERELDKVALVRVEQLYPFPHDELSATLQGYEAADEVIWCQEEPQNQGVWYNSQHHMLKCLQPGQTLKYAGRMHSAAPAVGSARKHKAEQAALLDDALTIWENQRQAAHG